MGVACCCLSTPSTPPITANSSPTLKPSAQPGTNSVSAATDDGKKRKLIRRTSPSSTTTNTRSSEDTPSSPHQQQLATVVCGVVHNSNNSSNKKNELTNSGLVPPVVHHHHHSSHQPSNSSKVSNVYRRTHSIDGSRSSYSSPENLPNRQASSSAGSRDGVRLNDPNFDSTRTPNPELVGFSGSDVDQIGGSDIPLSEHVLPIITSTTSTPTTSNLLENNKPNTQYQNLMDSEKSNNKQTPPPHLMISETTAATTSASAEDGSPPPPQQQHHQNEGASSLFDLAVASTSPEAATVNSKNTSVTSNGGGGNANALFSFLEHVSTSSRPSDEAVLGVGPGHMSPTLLQMSNKEDGDDDDSQQLPGNSEGSRPGQTSSTLPAKSNHLQPTSQISGVKSPVGHLLTTTVPADTSGFGSTDDTGSTSTRQGADTVTDSPRTAGDSSGMMSIDGAIPGMDDGLMNGLTELPDNFFAQLANGGDFPLDNMMGGMDPSSVSPPNGPPAGQDAFGGGGLFSFATEGDDDDNAVPLMAPSGGVDTLLPADDVDPRATLLSWASTEADQRTALPKDQYAFIDYSDAAYLSSSNPLSSGLFPPALTATAPSASPSSGNNTADIDVASLFSLLPAEETSQFSFGGRKRVANPFGGRKCKGKLDHAIFSPNNSWKGHDSPKMEPANSTSTSNGATTTAASSSGTKDVIKMDGRKGKKENPLLKYLKNDIEDEAASDGGSSSTSTVDDSVTKNPNDPNTHRDDLTRRTSRTSISAPLEDPHKLRKQLKRQLRRQEREERLQKDLEVQYQARVIAVRQRQEGNRLALREEMRKALLGHPSIVTVARTIGSSVISTSEHLAADRRLNSEEDGGGGDGREKSPVRVWSPSISANLGANLQRSQQQESNNNSTSQQQHPQLISISGAHSSANTSSSNQLFNVMLHQPLSHSGSGGKGLAHPDCIGTSLLCAEANSTPNIPSKNTSVSDAANSSGPLQPQEEWLLAIAKDLSVQFEGSQTARPPSSSSRAVSSGPLSRGEALLVEAVSKLCSPETQTIVDSVVDRIPREHKKHQAEIKKRNQMCVWGSYHNSIVVKLANVVSEHVANGNFFPPTTMISSNEDRLQSPLSPDTTTTTDSSCPPPPPSTPCRVPPHSVMFTGPSIAVQDPLSVSDPELVDFLSRRAIGAVGFVPKSKSIYTEHRPPGHTFANQQGGSNSSATEIILSPKAHSDRLTTTHVPVVLGSISSWRRMSEADLPQSLQVSALEKHLGDTASTQHLQFPPTSTASSTPASTTSVPPSSLTTDRRLTSPSMMSALTLPDSSKVPYIRSTHRLNAVVSFKPSVTLLTTKLASDCVVSISVPSAIMTTKRRRRSQSVIDTCSENSLLNMTNGAGEDYETTTNLVVHPVPYLVQPLQPPGNSQLIGPTVRPLIARHQELIAAATAQSRSNTNLSDSPQSHTPSIDQNARAAGVTDDDLAILKKLSAFSSHSASPNTHNSSSSNLNSSSSGMRVKGSLKGSLRSDSVQSRGPSNIPTPLATSPPVANTNANSPSTIHAIHDQNKVQTGAEHTDSIVRFGLLSDSPHHEDDFITEQTTFRTMTEEGRKQVSSIPRGPAVGLILTNNGANVAMSAPDLSSRSNSSPVAMMRDGGAGGGASVGIPSMSGSSIPHSPSCDIGIVDTRKAAGSGGGGSGSANRCNSMVSSHTSTSREVHPRRAEEMAAVRREKKAEARRASRVSSASSKNGGDLPRPSPRRAGSVPSSSRNASVSAVIGGASAVMDSSSDTLFQIEPVGSAGSAHRSNEYGSTSSARSGGRFRAGSATNNVNTTTPSTPQQPSTLFSLRNFDDKHDSISSAISSRLISGSVNPLKDDIIAVGIEVIIHAMECKKRQSNGCGSGGGGGFGASSSTTLDDSEGEEEEALVEVPLLTNSNQEANFARHMTMQRSADGNVSMVSDGGGKGAVETAGGLGGTSLGGSVSQL